MVLYLSKSRTYQHTKWYTVQSLTTWTIPLIWIIRVDIFSVILLCIDGSFFRFLVFMDGYVNLRSNCTRSDWPIGRVTTGTVRILMVQLVVLYNVEYYDTCGTCNLCTSLRGILYQASGCVSTDRTKLFTLQNPGISTMAHLCECANHNLPVETLPQRTYELRILCTMIQKNSTFPSYGS